jgi:hypothetical protein
MRRLLAWILVTLGIAAVARRLRRRERGGEGDVTVTSNQGDPADELRQKLAASRGEEADTTEAPAPEVPVEDRRAEIHEQGRATLDEMRPPSDEG